MSDHNPLCCLPIGRGKTVVFDLGDYAQVTAHHWWAYFPRLGYCYPQAYIDGKYITLHRFLMRPPKGLHVDHINHDTLDCRRSNLRLCTPAQNMANKNGRNPIGFKGIRKISSTGNFVARICVGSKEIHLGTYESDIDAAIAYDLAAIRFYGEFARTNVIL